MKKYLIILFLFAGLTVFGQYSGIPHKDVNVTIVAGNVGITNTTVTANITNSYLTSIDYFVKSIIDGKAYTSTYYTNDLDISAPLYFNIKVPALTYPLVCIEVTADSPVTVDTIMWTAHEGVTNAIHMRNPNIAPSAGTTFTTMGTYASGTIVATHILGATNNTSMIASPATRFYRLQSGSTNAFKITAQRDDTKCAATISIYE